IASRERANSTCQGWRATSLVSIGSRAGTVVASSSPSILRRTNSVPTNLIEYLITTDHGRAKSVPVANRAGWPRTGNESADRHLQRQDSWRTGLASSAGYRVSRRHARCSPMIDEALAFDAG